MPSSDSDDKHQPQQESSFESHSMKAQKTDAHAGDEYTLPNDDSLRYKTVQQPDFTPRDNADRQQPLARDSDDPGANLGLVIGRYRLVRKIAEGGMGAVFEAEQEEPVRRRVALKLVRAGLNSREISLRFEAERQALAMMDHPNIAKILDAGTGQNEQLYFVMELIDGAPLTDYCDQNQLCLTRRLELFASVCDAVHHAHQKGIIHRDLKPSNILVSVVDGVPTPKIIDFGLAKALDATSRLTDQSMMTGHGQILGTLKYMSPEQAGAEPNDIDTRSDIYALGVILYELLTGSTPIESETLRNQAIARVLEIIRNEEAQRPSQRLSSTHHDRITAVAANRQVDLKRLQSALIGDLDWIVMKSLEKERERRFQSAAAFGEDIRRFLNDEPVRARPPSKIYQARKFVRKNRFAVIASSAVLVSLLAGLVVSGIGFFRAKRAEELADQRYVAEQNSRQDAEQQRAIAEEKREAAERNLAFALQSNEVLFTVFEELDPEAEYATIGDLRASLGHQLLSASKNLTQSELGSPVVEANLRMRLGISLIGLGMFDEARPLLIEAAELHTKTGGPFDRQTLLCKLNLASLSIHSSDLSASLAEHESLLELCREHLGEYDEQTVDCLQSLAQIQCLVGAYDSALANFSIVIEKRTESQGESGKGTIDSRYARAQLLREIGQAEMALDELTTLVSLFTDMVGKTAPMTMRVRNSLAVAHLDLGNYAISKSMLEDSLSDVTEMLGAQHPQTIAIWSNLALVHRGLGEYDKAFEAAKQAASKAEQHFGPKNADSVRTKQVLAGAYEDIGDRDAALEIYPDLIEIMEEIFDPDHPRTLETMNNYAYALQFEKRFPESIEWYEKAIAGAKRKLSLEHPMTLTILDGLGRTHLLADQPELAINAFREEVGGWEKIAPPSYAAYLKARLNLAASLERSKRIEESIQVLRLALTDLEQVLEANDPNLLDVLRRLALALDEASQTDEASRLHRRASEGFLESAPEHPVAESTVIAAIEFFERIGDAMTAETLSKRWQEKQTRPDEDEQSR